MFKFVIKRATNNQYYWIFVASNGETLCTSETYVSKQSAIHSIQLVKDNAASVKVVDET